MSVSKWRVNIFKVVLVSAVLGGAAACSSDHMMAGSAAKQTIAWLEGIRSSVNVYYGDTEGKAYPGSLDVLLEKKYMSEIPQARIYAKTKGGDFDRVHKGKETQVKIFGSRKEADDTGGWGYVADPASKEYGAVFVNCTHMYMGAGPDKGVPWNSL